MMLEFERQIQKQEKEDAGSRRHRQHYDFANP